MSNRFRLAVSTAALALLPAMALAQTPASASPSAPAPSSAQPSPAAPPVATATGQETLLGEVIVTAEKREASLQQVPVAVTAFTSEKRDLIGINSVVDQTNYTPGLTYTEGNDRLSLRGVGRLTNSHTADSGTAIYVDGVFTTSTTQAGRSPLFIERTEVLRGPQGTLYGRNAIGGAYNVISRQPAKDFSGEVRATFGNYDRQRLDAAVSVPINDWLRTKFGYTKLHQGDGFITNTVDGENSLNGRREEEYFEFQAAGEIGKLDYWLYAGFNRWDNSATPGGPNGFSNTPSNTTLGNGATPNASFCFTNAINCRFVGVAGNPFLATGNNRTITEDTPFQNQLHDADAYNLHLTYHFNNFDVKYIGGWQRYDYKYQDDTDGSGVQSYQVPLSPTAAPIASVPGLGGVNCFQLQAVGACRPATVVLGLENTYEEDEEFYSHEINFSSTWDKPIQYIVGLYYYHEKFQYPQIGYSHQPQVLTPILPSGAAAAPNPLGQYFYTNNYSSVSSKAVFAQLDWKVFDTLKLTGGIRYTNDEKKATEEERFVYYGDGAGTPLARFGSNAPAVDITALALGAATPAQLAAQGGVQQGVVTPVSYDPATGRYRRGLRDGSNAVTGTAGFEWTPDRRTLLYGKYSRGYKAFGFNTVVATAFSPFPYSKPEQMDALEVGLKKDWTRRFQTNIVGFYNLYYDAQVPLSVQQGTTPAFSIFYNVPRSILQGVEVETVWQPVDRFNILFTYAYLDSHVSKACCVSDNNDPFAIAPGASPAGASSQGAVDTNFNLPAQGQNLKGNALPFTPHHKIALNFNYSYDLGGWGTLIPSFSWLHRSEQYSSFFNRSYNKIGDTDQLDARVTYRDPKSRYIVIGYVRNLLDDDIFVSQGGSRLTTDPVARYGSYSLQEPRTFGVEFQAKF